MALKMNISKYCWHLRLLLYGRVGFTATVEGSVRSLNHVIGVVFTNTTDLCEYVLTLETEKVNSSHPHFRTKWIIICDFIAPFWLKPLLQYWHTNGFSPVCILTCCSNANFVLNVLWQMSHRCLKPSPDLRRFRGSVRIESETGIKHHIKE